jgi:hypothetical protein
VVFFGGKFSLLGDKKLQRKYFVTDSQCFQRIPCHFLGKKIPQIETWVLALVQFVAKFWQLAQFLKKGIAS